jgi:hypothetical protein
VHHPESCDSFRAHHSNFTTRRLARRVVLFVCMIVRSRTSTNRPMSFTRVVHRLATPEFHSQRHRCRVSPQFTRNPCRRLNSHPDWTDEQCVGISQQGKHAADTPHASKDRSRNVKRTPRSSEALPIPTSKCRPSTRCRSGPQSRRRFFWSHHALVASSTSSSRAKSKVPARAFLPSRRMTSGSACRASRRPCRESPARSAQSRARRIGLP